MKNYCKRFLLGFVALALTLSVFSGYKLNLKAEEKYPSGVCGKTTNEGGAASVKWTVKNSVLLIEGKGDMADYSDGTQPYAQYLDEIVEIKISEGVTSIGNHAFNTPYFWVLEMIPTSNVTKVTIPSTVTKIGDYAFRGLAELDAISLPEGIVSIGIEAFYDCDDLITVILPDSLKELGAKAFKRCSGLVSIQIGRNLKEIKDETFYSCSALEYVKFKTFTAPKIGEEVFTWDKTKFAVPKGYKALFVKALGLEKKEEFKVTEYAHFKMTVTNTNNGTTTVDQTYVYEKDDKVVVNVTPAEGFRVDEATYSWGGKLYTIKLTGEEYSFKAPNSDVTIKVTYTETDETLFYQYIEQLKNQLDELLNAEDSEAVIQIVEDAKEDLGELVFNEEITLDANKELADAIAEPVAADVELQRLKDAFDAAKEEAKTNLDALLNDQDPQNVKKIVEDAKADIDALEYDEEKTYDENNAEIEQIVEPVAAALDLQRDKNSFEAKKNDSKKALNNYKLAEDSEETQKIIADAIKAINNLTYDEEKTLAENKAKVDEIVKDAKNKVDYQRKQEQLVKDLEEFYNALDAEPSEELQKIYSEYKELLEAQEYDAKEELAVNLQAIEELFEEAKKALQLQHDKEALEELRKEDQKSLDLAKENKVYSDETKKVIDELQKEFNDYTFDEEKTLEENEAQLQAIYEKLLKVLKEIPVLLSGDGQEILSDVKQELGFRSSAPIGTFIEFRLNGEVVDPSNYDVTEGSTIVTLHADYVKKLQPGTYEIEIVSTGGVATGSFVVTENTNVNWTTVACVGVPVILVCVLIALFSKKKKQEQPAEQA